MGRSSMAYCCEPLGCVILNEVKNQLPQHSAQDSDSSLRSE
jgi:hypothetical protein